MVIDQFIKELEALKVIGITEVVLSQDEEGNGYMDKCFFNQLKKGTIAVMPYNYVEII